MAPMGGRDDVTTRLRRDRFERQHPGIKIRADELYAWWEAFWVEGCRRFVIVRHRLSDLLDELDRRMGGP